MVVSAENLAPYSLKLARSGLAVLPLNFGLNDNSQAYRFRVAAGRSEEVRVFADAWNNSDDEEIGRLLGYPACCRAFFKGLWKSEKLRDTTWRMASLSAPDASTHSIDICNVSYANILWRWLGVRAVPHLPCSFACKASHNLGEELVQLGRTIGYANAMSWLADILSWPVEWSALHGIAEIRTPILKVCTMTDATANKLTVRYIGQAYPSEGAVGRVFPYRDKRTLVQLSTVPRSPEPRPESLEWYYTDNGFSSVHAMDSAQRPIVDLASKLQLPRGKRVVDLGCGNGALLRKIANANQAIAFGIDCDPVRISHAYSLFQGVPANFVTGDLAEADVAWTSKPHFSIGLIMPGRLLEISTKGCVRVRRFLRERCQFVLVYAYGDWIRKFGSLRDLSAKAGLSLVSEGPTPATGIAVVE
jgi:hypothetical protein